MTRRDTLHRQLLLNSPSRVTTNPLAREHERDYCRYYCHGIMNAQALPLT